MCKKCDYVLGSQVHDIDWNRYDSGHMHAIPDADGQTRRVRKYEPKRRNPLNFKGEN